MEAVLTELEAALGHGFAKPELLVCALTHRSLANQQTQERTGPGRSALPAAATMNGLSFWGMRSSAW